MSQKSKYISGGVTAPKGFVASGINCGLRLRKEDLGFIFSETLCDAACVFTQNSVQAAPVLVSKAHVAGGKAHGVIVNSANANCCTGKRGLHDAEMMAALTARAAGVKSRDILVASTGIIGKRLPFDRISASIPKLVKVAARNKAKQFQRSILTTDTTEKYTAVSFMCGGKVVKIGGAAKGSGMIHPNMATMLAFITTDISIDRKLLREALVSAVQSTFNMISIDGEMSTNDTVMVFANGQAGNATLKRKDAHFERFCRYLTLVCQKLAEQIVFDGEGATKFVTVTVRGAKNNRDARHIARHVTCSNLIKTAVFGENPNWGRVASSVGSAGVKFDQNRLNIYFDGCKVASGGAGTNANGSKLLRIFRKKKLDLVVDIGKGQGRAQALTCDLSHDYVRINTAYS